MALCIRIHRWDVPSTAFAQRYPPSQPMLVRFVVTVDEMLFGALPMSAVPSVVIAGFFVVFAILGILPRIVKAM
jgi:hypothetical protein